MRSALTAIRWRARSASLLRTRFVLIIDNQSSFAVLVKSRSSSRKLNAVARKTAAFLLCILSRPLYAYTDTDRNHADAAGGVVLNTLTQYRLQSPRQNGSPQQLRVQLRTRCRYKDAVTAFSTWLRDNS